MFMKLTVLILGAMLLLAAPGALAQSTTTAAQARAMLTGKVKNKQDAAIAKARITVYQVVDDPDPPVVGTAESDATGEYAIKIPLGAMYRVVTQADGMERSVVSVSTQGMNAPDLTTIIKQDFTLAPARN